MHRCTRDLGAQSSDASMSEVLRWAADPVDEFVALHNLTGTQVVVYYPSTSASYGVFSCPVRAGRQGAIEAAKLALEEAADFPIGLNPHRTGLISIDQAHEPIGKGYRIGNAHVFGIAERDSVAREINDWVRARGLRLDSMLPIGAASMLAAISEATAGGRSGSTRVVLRLFDKEGVLAAAHGTTLKFVRTISTGVRSLFEALGNEIRTTDRDRPTIRLTLSEAEALLFEVGIPQSGEMVDEQRGITADALLPLLQPILQRCIVETKQSIRFGLSASEREGARLHVSGMASRIPGFAALMARQTGLSLEDSGENANQHDSRPKVVQGQAMLGFVPIEVQQARLTRRLRTALAGGVAAAFLFLTLDAVNTHIEMERVRESAESLRGRLRDARVAVQASELLSHAEGSLAGAHSQIASLVAGHARWDAVMTLLSQSVSDSVWFTRLHMTRDRGFPVCRINGEVRAESHQAASMIFMNLINTLGAAPIVSRCSIETVVRDRAEAGTQRFELLLQLHPVAPNARALASDDVVQPGNNGSQP